MKLIQEIEDCCPAVTEAPLSAVEAEQVAAALKAIADPARLRLISLLASQPSCEACVCDLTEPVGLTQPTVSHHLKVLHEAGFLEREKRGTWVYYKLLPNALRSIRRALA